MRTIKEFAKDAGVSEITVKRWIKSGKIESEKIGGARRITDKRWSEKGERNDKG